ncbi:MAG TPA: arsenosugar biosynthesis radical SAM (seleno)protein ArsS [Pseudomonadales bacterium]|nr:arsenosugar biosynthesis radical SAM (seleno)protein ArsS [Pseudomonadales bacterium]
MRSTLPLLEVTDFPLIKRGKLETLQLNLGYVCNQSCVHCHVNAGPTRTEAMQRNTMQTALKLAQRHNISVFDLTGGAPELNPHFRWLVESARGQGIHVMDRCNLTVLFEEGQADLADFLAANQVEIVASLPCYLETNVDAQRGKGVYEKSIRALQRLNALGYGQAGTGLKLNLVYNPGGAFLPPAQSVLEADYKAHLANDFGIQFNQLFTLANMPIQRFGAVLLAKGEFESYMTLLKSAYREENLNQLMCRHLISVDWQGFVYDCDFNQMLDLPMRGKKQHLDELLDQTFAGNAIAVADHCWGCAAGQGSSCGGALS